MPLVWRQIPEDGDPKVYLGDSVELDYEMLVSLIKFGDDPELWQLDVNFYDLDGERVPGFPMSPPGMEFPLDEAMTISERIHADAIAWAEANPEWKKSWSKMDANARIVRLFLPMASLMPPGMSDVFAAHARPRGKIKSLTYRISGMLGLLLTIPVRVNNKRR